MYEDAILSPGWLAGRAAQEWSLWATVRSCASLSTTWCVVSVMESVMTDNCRALPCRNGLLRPAGRGTLPSFPGGRTGEVENVVGEQERVNLRGQSLM